MHACGKFSEAFDVVKALLPTNDQVSCKLHLMKLCLDAAAAVGDDDDKTLWDKRLEECSQLLKEHDIPMRWFFEGLMKRQQSIYKWVPPWFTLYFISCV